MSIYLGNLSVQQIQDRVKVPFSEECIEFLEATHQDSANSIGKDEWHCFDMPFTMACGSREMAMKVYEHLKDIGGSFEIPLEISIKGKIE